MDYSTKKTNVNKRKVIHQTNAKLAGKSFEQLFGKAHPIDEPNVLETLQQAEPCSLFNEIARMSSSGFEECGICKNARLGQFL